LVDSVIFIPLRVLVQMNLGPARTSIIKPEA